VLRRVRDGTTIASSDSQKRAEMEAAMTTNVAITTDTEEGDSRRNELGEAAASADIVGSSEPLRVALRRVEKVAPIDSTVLITGETGTGKELFARAIHAASRRNAYPFVSMNCAAIPTSLIASELFGHERGAFTGAMQRRLGRFEMATGGTLFLDEVGELPTETQIALLRVLQEREFERLGGTTPVRANVRIVAATHRDLGAAVASGTFRSDLYYRLNVFPIEIPPLRDRTGDVSTLAEVFVERYARRANKRIRGISENTLELLKAHSWPGNVRELQNVIERSVIMCDSEVLSIDSTWLLGGAPPAEPTYPPLRLVPLPARQSRPGESSPSNATLKEIQHAAILRVLRSTNWKVGGPNGAAVILGVSRTTLQSRMQKLGIVPPKCDRQLGAPFQAASGETMAYHSKEASWPGQTGHSHQ
jgi:transcriptional regulator with GAF, ATPase, and Fis domain